MIGTIVNTCAIIAGAVIGAILNRGIKEKYKTVLYDGLGMVSLAIGLNATLSRMPVSECPVLFVIAIAAGGVVGTMLDIDSRFRKLINKIGQSQSNNLANGLATAILLFCIGPLSILGPVMSAVDGDNTFLFTNATLDFVSSIVFASTYGVWIMLAAPVLFCWQSSFYVAGMFSAEVLGSSLMTELLIVGGILISLSGLSLLKLKDCHPLNFLPSLIVPILWYIFS